MMTIMEKRAARRCAWLLLVPGLTVVLAACSVDELLEVEEPTFATPESLRNPAGLGVLYAGALGDFQVAYSGAGGDAFLTATSLISDELKTSDTFTTRQATDQREQLPTEQGNLSDAAYNRLQYARRSAGEVADVIVEISEQGNSDPRYATLKALEGYTVVALAEGFCGAVPLSTARNATPGELGEPLSTQQLFTTAAGIFDQALTANSASNLAKIGKARALLNNGDFQAAAAAVAGVPTTFVHFVEHSANSGRQNNPLFSLQANGRYTMSDREGQNGLPYLTAGDARLPWFQDSRGGFDNAVPLFISQRYPTFGSDVVLADGIEARLIEAEAALRSNDAAAWLSTLNELRAQVGTLMAARYEAWATNVPSANVPSATLAPLTDPGTESGRVDLMFQERAYWLYLTGHRQGDMRRLVRQYGRTETQVFPIGTHHRGGSYGNHVAFPIPFQETQNPTYQVTLCDVSAS